MVLPILYISSTKHKGRGVFTHEYIAKDTIIEVAPVIIMPLTEKTHIDQTLLHDYIFMWGSNEDQICMALGYVPIYNHDYDSNCDYDMDSDNNTIIISTVKSIRAQEELTINYNGLYNDKTPLWFKVIPK
jgi:uncharacterized protein